MKRILNYFSGRLITTDPLKRVSITQLTSTNNKLENFENCAKLVEEGAVNGSNFIFFPENFSFFGSPTDDVFEEAESINSQLMRDYIDLAKEFEIFISYGGFCEEIEGQNEDRKVYNTHIIVDDEGNVVEEYRKIHMFDIMLPEMEILESLNVKGGNEFKVVEKTPIGEIGLSTCYDVRFPEMYVYLSRYMGAKSLIIPAAFTYRTGMEHWETLMRARSIENQCFVIASAQTGWNNENRECYGHSMVVSPFGRVLCDIDRERTNVVETVEIDLSEVENVRKYMPCLEHRRDEIYEIKYKNKKS